MECGTLCFVARVVQDRGPQNWVLRMFFSDRTKFSPHLWRMSKSVWLLFHVYPMLFVLQMTLFQCLLAAYFGSPVRPCVKCKHTLNMLFYFRSKDRFT